VKRYGLLIVDDENDILRALSLTFAEEYNVFTATSGAQALEILEKEEIALIIADQRMPEMSGIDFLEVLRSYLRFSDLPVVLLTGYDYDTARVERLGVKHVFVKGEVNPGDVVAWIEKNLS